MTVFDTLGDVPIERLKSLMDRLRAECPWDKEQDFQSIAPHTIEEAYEVADCIARNDLTGLKEELGDLLFQVIFHAKLGEETQSFDFDSICDALTQKMIARHPHVFSSVENRSAEEQTHAWEALKATERNAKGHISILDGIALNLPALTRAEKLQKRAARVGFDWPDINDVFGKIDEETNEVKVAMADEDIDAIEDEIGDLIFAVVNLARKAGVDAETALRRTNRKFTTRFTHIEKVAGESDQSVQDLSLDEMEAIWQSAKTKPE